MKAKIILSLSILRAGAKGFSYICPDGTVQEGVQTNEAPVKYLLRKNPSIKQVICLVTPTARDSALEYFCGEINREYPEVSIEVIDTPDNGKLPDKTMAELTRTLNPGDCVYLDSSGGSRYTIMGLLQLARILEFKGVSLCQVVYANLPISKDQDPTIDDVTELYSSLDLISGMQELADFGSVASLRRYFDRNASADAAVMVSLLDSIEQMTDAITLSRPGVLKKATAAYEEAMARTEAIRDPVMRELTGILRQKFGEEITIPWLLDWCLDHRMLTQALSLYREWMPEYILRSSGLFTGVPELPGWWKTNKHQDRNVFVWEWMMNLALPEGRDLNMRCTIKSIRELEKYLPIHGFAVTDVERLRKAAWDYQYIREMRNMVVHGNEKAFKDRHLRSALKEMGYPVKVNEMSVSDMLAQVRQALDHVKG